MERNKCDALKQSLSPRRDDEEKYIFEILGLDLKDWPPPHRMPRKTLNEKYHRLSEIMEDHNFILEFSSKIPILDAYRYLTEVLLYEKDYDLNEGWTCRVTGCGGDCPGCFQREYCYVLTDTWTQEEMEIELICRCKQDAGIRNS
jgi:hypothetical protein